MCVSDSLTLEERDQAEIVVDEPRAEDVEVGLEAMIKEHGLQKVMDIVARKAKKA
jgi:hypothetical protein